MTGTRYILLAIFVSALITFALRALPFVLFHGDREMPPSLVKLGKLLPSSIMAVLIVYCLRGARSDFLGQGLPGLIALAMVVISYKLRHNTFLSIILGTAVYMLLIRLW